MAIKEWVRLKDGKSLALEKALVAFDMFVLHERDGDFDDVRPGQLLWETIIC